MTVPPVPASETEITAEWLGMVLADVFPEPVPATVVKSRIGADYGFASHIYRCRWKAGRQAQSVVVKLWDITSTTGSNEVYFYQTFPQPGLRVPRGFHAGLDERNGRAVLVLEDFPGAVQGDVLELLDLELAQAVARELAGLHAAWLAHASLERLDWLTDVSSWMLEPAWYYSRREEYLERFGDRLDGLARRLLDNLLLAPEAANRRLAAAPRTLLHGDFHLDNFIFEDATKPVLLDWSRPQVGPAAINLASLLFSMAPLGIFDPVLDTYLQAFNQLSQAGLDRATAERQLGGALLRKFSIDTLGIATWRPTLPRAVQIVEASPSMMNEVLAFWQSRDPGLFSFLD